MKNKNFWKEGLYHIWSIILALSIFLGALSLSISLNSSDLNYYHKFQIDNGIDLVTGKSQEELDKITYDLTSYLDNGQESLLKKHFNEREIAHMRDVFSLYELNRRVTSISVTVVVLTLILNLVFKNRARMTKKTLYYLIGLIAISVIFAVLASTDFNKYFVGFHELFFDNDLWLLDPATDLMIQMLPLNFFTGIAKNIFIYFAIALLAVFIILVYDVYFNKNKKRCLLCNFRVVG